ncbi:MAG: S9 family peptidase [Asgard group archaeon]|nr:S9 family peptidase [Asgard group archaeon]
MSTSKRKKKNPNIIPEDLFKLKQITQVTIRPSSQEVFFTMNQAFKEDNGYRNSIWRYKDGETRKFTQGLPSDGAMKWSPDGKTLAFVSVRGVLAKPSVGKQTEPPKSQIYLMPFDGGEAIQLTKMPNGVMPFFEWSDDGTKIIFISRLNEEELSEPTPEEIKEMDPEVITLKKINKQKSEEKKLDPRIITRDVYRTGTAFKDDRYGQIHVIDIETEKIERWTNNLEDDYTFAFLASDNSFAYTSRRRPGEGDECRFFDFIKVFPDGEVEVIVKDHFAEGFFRPSPDGKFLASITGDEELGTMSQGTLCISDVKTGEKKLIAKDFDKRIAFPKWSKDSKYLYFIVFDKARLQIWRTKTESWKLKEIVNEDLQVVDYDISTDNKIIAYHAWYVDDPSQLHLFDLSSKENQLIYEPNKEFLKTKKLGKTEEVWYDGCNKDYKIQGWILYPHNFDSKKKYPLALNMHGGPHVMWSNHQSIPMFHEFQIMAAEGYVVFYCNPRGSSGYGQEFYKAIEKSWGDKDSIDILNGVDLVVKRGFIDKDRMGITGGSYAGFMTAWIVGHDNRFAAAVAQRGVYHISNFWATTDWARILIDDEFGTIPTQDHKFLWERSPAAYAKNMTTPLRIIHSETDYRAPIPDAEMLYMAIKREAPDLDVEFLRYPGEGHELSRSGQPNRRIDRLYKIMEWFDKYCQPDKIEKQKEKSKKIKEIKKEFKQKLQEEIKKLEG